MCERKFTLSVPVDIASDKREHAARTLRPKLHRYLDKYLVDLNTTAVQQDASRLSIDGEDLSDPDALLNRLEVNRDITPVDCFRGGTAEAKRVFRRFLDHRLSAYEANCCRALKTDHLCAMKIDQGPVPSDCSLGVFRL